MREKLRFLGLDVHAETIKLLDFYEWEVRNCVASTPSQFYDLSTAIPSEIYIPWTGDNLTQTTIETPTSAVVRWLAFD